MANLFLLFVSAMLAVYGFYKSGETEVPKFMAVGYYICGQMCVIAAIIFLLLLIL